MISIALSKNKQPIAFAIEFTKRLPLPSNKRERFHIELDQRTDESEIYIFDENGQGNLFCIIDKTASSTIEEGLEFQLYKDRTSYMVNALDIDSMPVETIDEAIREYLRKVLPEYIKQEDFPDSGESMDVCVPDAFSAAIRVFMNRGHRLVISSSCGLKSGEISVDAGDILLTGLDKF